MTKNEEIQAYHQFIQTLPEASYIRPWFIEIAMEVESIIRSDYPVRLSPRTAQLEAKAILESAREEAAKIRQSASDDANATRFAAHESAAKIRYNAKDALRAIADRI
jgi:hypothetical protein